MSTVTDTFVEVAARDLSDHDFELPCGITKRSGKCTHTAEWWAQFAPHCANDPFDMLLCPDHFAFVMDGGTAICQVCGSAVNCGEHLIRTERIKP